MLPTCIAKKAIFLLEKMPYDPDVQEVIDGLKGYIDERYVTDYHDAMEFDRMFLASFGGMEEL